MSESPTQKSFQFELVSPEKILASKQVKRVIIPGEAGDFGVLADHAPLLSSLRNGLVTVTEEDGSVSKLFISGGFADVNDNLCSVLAEEAIPLEELNSEALSTELQNLIEEKNLRASDDEAIKTADLEHDITLVQAKLDALTLS